LSRRLVSLRLVQVSVKPCSINYINKQLERASTRVTKRHSKVLIQTRLWTALPVVLIALRVRYAGSIVMVNAVGFMPLQHMTSVRVPLSALASAARLYGLTNKHVYDGGSPDCVSVSMCESGSAEVRCRTRSRQRSDASSTKP